MSLLIALLALPARSQEERSVGNFAGVGARAMAMGGAFTGVADDITAMYWNPAGLAQITRNQVTLELQRGSRSDRSTLGGTGATSSLANTRLATLGAVMPYPVYQGSLVFAAGMLRLQDFDWSLRQRGFDGADSLFTDHRFGHEGGVWLGGLAAAMDVSPTLSLGATVGFTRGHDESTNEFTWADTLDRYRERRFMVNDSFRDDYQASLHAVVGAMLRTPREQPRYRLGVTMTASRARRIQYTFRGLLDANAYNVIQFDDGTVERNVVLGEDGSLTPASVDRYTGSYRLATPLEFAVGGSWVPVPGLLAAAGVHLAEWEQSRYDDEDEYGLRSGGSFRKQYRNVARYHVGVEWQVPAIALDLRAGYCWDPVPFVGPRDPEMPAGPTNPPIELDPDRRYLTLGAGLLIDRVVRLDGTWTHGAFTQTEGQLTEENTIDRLQAGLTCQF